MIVLLTILCKQFVTVCQGPGSLPNSKEAASHTPLTYVFLHLTIPFFSLVQFFSFHHKYLFRFSYGSSNSLVTVDFSCSDELPAPDYMGTNYQQTTLKLSWTVTLIKFLCSSCLALYSCGLMNFCFPPIFLLICS